MSIYHGHSIQSFCKSLLLYQNMQKGKSRQDPVSCQLCRSKKLKCNREQPCSNCTARGVSCKFHVPPPTSRTATVPAPQNHSEILDRLQRLETVILQPSPSESHLSHGSEDSRPAKRVAFTASRESPAENDVHRNRDQDTRVLEYVATREDSLVCYMQCLHAAY